MAYKVYALRATARSGRESIHIGISKDVQRRMVDHAAGRVKATRGRVIEWLGNTESMSHGDALRLESEMKKRSKCEKLAWASQQANSAKKKNVGG